MKFVLLLILAAAVLYPLELSAIEWRTDFDNSLSEAAERGAPVVLFLCQAT